TARHRPPWAPAKSSLLAQPPRAVSCARESIINTEPADNWHKTGPARNGTGTKKASQRTGIFVDWVTGTLDNQSRSDDPDYGESRRITWGLHTRPIRRARVRRT